MGLEVKSNSNNGSHSDGRSSDHESSSRIYSNSGRSVSKKEK